MVLFDDDIDPSLAGTAFPFAALTASLGPLARLQAKHGPERQSFLITAGTTPSNRSRHRRLLTVMMTV